MTIADQGISIIISVFGQNSEVNLLLKQLLHSNTKYNGEYEIIVIGDGYKVKINIPFIGGFITQHYGKPINNVHAIQIEINKKVYLSEKSFTVKNRNFNKLKNCFSDIINYINLRVI